jgi:ribosome-associated toxin RatA of RatAB toxin-antitoxin module
MNIRYEFEVRASARFLFELTQDYSCRPLWDPLTRQATLLNADRPSKGVLLRYTASNGLTMDTEYVSYKPFEVAAFKMVAGPRFFDRFAGGWQFKELAPNRTHVLFSYYITTKPRWLSWLLTPIVVFGFKRETKRRIRALILYAEQHAPAAA